MKWFVAIAVIGTCFALTLAVIWNAVQRGPGGHPFVEIDHLSQAIQAYKEEATQFPPCLADSGSRQGKERFMQHVQAAWINASEYQPTVAGYDETNRKVRDVWKYNFAKPDGSIDVLNLDNLDAAEALVFWLGGFPTPVDPTTKQPVTSRKLFGFHRDSDDPFKRDKSDAEGLDPFRYRTEPKFMFDPLRLVDNDGDGWLEYHPYPAGDPKRNAPYVYFDAPTYVDTKNHRDKLGSCFYPRDIALAASWGTAAPYMKRLNAQDIYQSTWWQDRSFQIVSAGLDGVYGPRGDGKTLPTRRISTTAPLQTFDAADGFQKPHATDHAEIDNLTSLSSTPLGQMPE